MQTMTTETEQPNGLPPAGRLDHAGRIAIKATLGWSGWGSPVGLSFLVASVGFLLLCLHWAAILH